MLFKRISPELPETVFIVGVNGTGGGTALVKDAPVCMDISSAADGVRVVTPTTAALWCGVGVVDADIPDGANGLIQIYGYRSSSRVFQTNTSQAAGLPLGLANAVNYLVSVVSTTATNVVATQVPIFGALVGSVASSSASAVASVAVFLKTLGM